MSVRPELLVTYECPNCGEEIKYLPDGPIGHSDSRCMIKLLSRISSQLGEMYTQLQEIELSINEKGKWT